MDEVFERYRGGAISFEVFARETRSHWAKLARMLLARWRVPAFVTEEDLVQEMLIGVWVAVEEWDPKRGPTLRTHATFRAVDKARKWIHKQRRAGHDGGKGHSRIDMPFSALVRDGEEGSFQDLIDRLTPATVHIQESAAAREQFRTRAGSLRQVLDVFEQTGSIEAAVDFCLSSQQAREDLGVSKFVHAKQEVRRMIEQYAAQVSLS